MKITDITNNLTNETNERMSLKFNRLMATSSRFKNLDQANRQVALDLIKKYKERAIKGIEPTRLMIKEDRLKLYQNRVKLGLSETDLKQMYSLLDSFKK
ncbi:hypothetical protein GW758_02895 [Candidatus Falkowbacteria bacterium]|nr:hypothetical protein [Candidatus Falkowbacteria bacterium]NCT54876.1 hypothetical protein [Candidatus Falkowbacteria bacterium]